jgi:hypothetical protein
LYIELNNAGETVNVQIFSIQGKLMHQEYTWIEKLSIDVANFNTGMYLLDISNNESKMQTKIVIE